MLSMLSMEDLQDEDRIPLFENKSSSPIKSVEEHLSLIKSRSRDASGVKQQRPGDEEIALLNVSEQVETIKSGPKTTTQQAVALAQEKETNVEEMNLWEAAKRGALTRLVQLIEDGVHCVDDLDEGRNSALHWAAINNHINVVMYLVDRGVPVDIIGGDLKATPLHWAARTGLVNMVHLLYKRGADPNIKDGQGYNSLHLATHGGHVMMVVYLLSIGLEVDSVDEYGRSSLMWAAYQGNNMEVLEELLRWKASLFLRDSTGYTALHWAIISSHYEFGMKLVEEGSDIDAKDPAGKTPGQWAEERGLSDQYDRILVDSGKRQTAGRFNGPPFSQATTNRILYMVPYVLIPAAMLILGYLPFYLAVPLCIGGITLFQNMFVIKYLLAKKPWKVPNTPLIASVAQATLFFVFITWLRIVPCKALLLIILPGSQKAKRY